MRPRHLVLVLALVAAIVPSNGQGWFALGGSGSTERAGALSRTRSGVAALPTAAPGTPPEYVVDVAPTAAPTVTTPALPPAEPPPPPLAPPPPTEPSPDPAPAPAPTPPPPVAPKSAPPPAVIAKVRTSGVAIYAAPGDAQPTSTLRGTTEFGTPRVLLTTLTSTTITDSWVQVLLPTRPNGSIGWVRTDSVDFGTVDDRITVDLAAHTVTWERGGEVVGVVNAAVGAPSTPTPPGTYFVTDVLPYSEVGASSASGQYGAWVVALDGHSDAFTTFAGGDARIAIHGTNQPGSIGTSTSSGCVRIAAGPLDTLAHNVALGSPVVIR